MNVLMLIRGGNVPQEKQEENMQAWGKYMEELKTRGVLRGGAPLSGGKVITAAGVEDYKASNMDVAGYMTLEVGSMEDAVKAAQMAPHFEHGGTIELREGMAM